MDYEYYAYKKLYIIVQMDYQDEALSLHIDQNEVENMLQCGTHSRRYNRVSWQKINTKTGKAAKA